VVPPLHAIVPDVDDAVSTVGSVTVIVVEDVQPRLSLTT
jgi:hypothetical protein